MNTNPVIRNSDEIATITMLLAEGVNLGKITQTILRKRREAKRVDEKETAFRQMCKEWHVA